MTRQGFNLNHYVWVKLTDLGYQRLADLHNEIPGIVRAFGSRTAEAYRAKADAEGYTKMQAWEFIKDFGEVTGMARPHHYDLEILIQSEDLHPTTPETK